MDLSVAVAVVPVGRLAIAVLGPDGVLDRFETEPRSAPFRWASVTKVITALTVLDACADGTIALDDAVGPPGCTVAHLLAHAGGVPPEEGGRFTEPGARRIYSNYGYELLARHLAERAGGPFADELDGRVLAPLGMTGTMVEGSPAHGGIGTIDDLAALGMELLTARALGPEVVAEISTVAFPGLTGILPGFGRQTDNAWGYGCEIRDSKDPHWTSASHSPATFGHFGQSGSFLWIDPQVRLGCAFLCDRDFGPWAAQAWPPLAGEVLRGYKSPLTRAADAPKPGFDGPGGSHVSDRLG